METGSVSVFDLFASGQTDIAAVLQSEAFR